LGNFEIIEKKKMTTIKERKKSRRKQFQIQISKHLMGLKVWFGVQQINIKKFGIHQHLGSQKLNLVLFPIFCFEKRF